VKLDAVDAVLAMPETHDFAGVPVPLSPGSDFKAVGQRLFRSDQAVIPGGLAGRLDARKDSAAVVQDGRDLAVHQSFVADHLRSVDFGDALMPEADSQDRNLWTEFFDDSS